MLPSWSLYIYTHFSFNILVIYSMLFSKTLSQNLNVARLFHLLAAVRLTKSYWHDLAGFEVWVSYRFQGLLSEPGTTNKKKNKSRERGNGKPVRQSLCAVFHYRTPWCKQMSELACPLNWILFRRGISQDGGLSLVVLADGNVKESVMQDQVRY